MRLLKLVLCALIVMIAAGSCSPAPGGITGERTDEWSMDDVVDGTLHVYDSPGGEIYRTSIILEEFAREGVRIAIHGYCDSACTMVLGHPGVCAGPRAVFRFHAAAIHLSGGRRKQYDEGTRFMLDHVPDAVRGMLPLAEDMRVNRWHVYRAFVLRSRMDLPLC